MKKIISLYAITLLFASVEAMRPRPDGTSKLPFVAIDIAQAPETVKELHATIRNHHMKRGTCDFCAERCVDSATQREKIVFCPCERKMYCSKTCRRKGMQNHQSLCTLYKINDAGLIKTEQAKDEQAAIAAAAAPVMEEQAVAYAQRLKKLFDPTNL